MLPRQRRMTRRVDWKLLHARGKTVHGTYVVLKYRRVSEPNTRFGFIVGTKVSKKAVVRNAVKRRLRHIASQEADGLRANMDIAIIARPSAHKASFQAVRADVRTALQKARLYKTAPHNTTGK